MDVKELKKKYSALLNDIEFDELDLGLKQPNIFKVEYKFIENSELLKNLKAKI